MADNKTETIDGPVEINQGPMGINAREQAEQFLREENQKRVQACWKDLNEVLEKHGLQFSVTTILTGESRIMHRIDLV